MESPTPRWLATAVTGLSAAACFAIASHVAAAEKPVAHTVIIEGVAYQPDALKVKRGDTVIWINKDPFPHTVTAARAFDSKDIAAGASWKYVARRAGSHSYICTLHPNMKGTLTIE